MNDNDIYKKIKNLDLFPGSLEEYIQYKKQNSEISDGETIEFIPPVMLASYPGPTEVLTKLVEEGCSGLIRCISYGHSYIKGIPVRIKRRNTPFRD